MVGAVAPSQKEGPPLPARARSARPVFALREADTESSKCRMPCGDLNRYLEMMSLASTRPWVHAIATLRGWWLPGDARGFRSRAHRIHSSGDYKSPPPKDEHRGLREYNEPRSHRIRPLSRVERAIVVHAIAEKLVASKCQVLVIACDATHAHALFRADGIDASIPFGRAKQLSTFRVKRREGRMWGQHAGIDRIKDRAHQLAVFNYIAKHEAKGAVVWRFDREGKAGASDKASFTSPKAAQ